MNKALHLMWWNWVFASIVTIFFMPDNYWKYLSYIPMAIALIYVVLGDKE